MADVNHKPMSFPLTVIVSMLAVKLAECEFPKFQAALQNDGLTDKIIFKQLHSEDNLGDMSVYFNNMRPLNKYLKFLDGNFKQYERNAYHWDIYKKNKCEEIIEIHDRIMQCVNILEPECEKMFVALKNKFDDECCMFTNSVARCCNMLSLLRLNQSTINACIAERNMSPQQESTLRLLNADQLNTCADRIRKMIFTPEDVDVMDSSATQMLIQTFSNLVISLYKQHFMVKNTETDEN